MYMRVLVLAIHVLATSATHLVPTLTSEPQSGPIENTTYRVTVAQIF